MFNVNNIIKGWVTSIIGTLFLIASVVHFVYPFFDDNFEANISLLLVGALLGGGFLLVPDDLVKRLINSKKYD